MSDDAGYKKLIADMELRPLTYEDVAKDWEANSMEWYHAIIAFEDLSIVLAIPNLKIYAWCRCKLIADDGSEAHYHWHGLVHFPCGKLKSWKQQAWRDNVRFTSKKNTFKKVKCLDHAVGILRYVSCADGQKVGRRDDDGLVTRPHTHYSRQPIEGCHRHARGKECVKVRDCISESIASFIKLDEKPNWDKLNLHDVQLCSCDRGNIGKQKTAAANERRRQFYKSTEGIATRERYREKARIKNMILNQLTQFNVTKKAELTLETIANLVKQLQ